MASLTHLVGVGRLRQWVASDLGDAQRPGRVKRSEPFQMRAIAQHIGSQRLDVVSRWLGRFGARPVIHPYPTQAEAIKKIGDAYNRTRLTPFVKSLFEKWLAWVR